MSRLVGNPYALVLDLVSLAIGFYGINGTILTRELPAHLSGAGNWQFLTNLSLVYAMLVFAVGALAHFCRSQRLFRLKNNLHPIALALETVVAGVYWPLRLFFLHLLVKDPAQFALPILADLAIHLMPVVSLMIDYFAFMPRWTMGKSSAFGTCALLTTAYWFWLHHIIDFENGGDFPYAFLSVPNVYHRMVIFSLVGLSGFSQYLLMSNVYNWVVPKEGTE
ncbi:FAR-17a/AIG1-like protein [[Candida] zeylanoides]